MSPRARRLFTSFLCLGFITGCARLAPPAANPGVTTSLSPPPSTSEATPADTPVGRRSSPGTPFSRAKPTAPFEPALLVTTQVAHADLFFHTQTIGGPRYSPTRQIYRGQRAFILAFAGNYGRDALTRTDLTYRLIIHKPDGTTDGAPFDGVIWQDEVGSPNLVLFPASTVTFWTEPTDPLGDYRFSLRAVDHLSGDSVDLTHTVTLVDYVPPVLAATFDPNLWFNTYYQRPTPELALPALARIFAKLPADKRQSALPPLLGFYDQILTDNTWLLPAFATRLASAEADEAFALSVVLGFHFRNTSDAPDGFPAALWARLADFRSSPWPADPEAPLNIPSQFDALWGRFYASALYAPLRRLVEPLQNTADLGASTRWQAAHPPAAAPASTGESLLPPPALPAEDDPGSLDLEDPATPAAVRREILLRTALWSLRANAAQHPLVRGYLDWTLRFGDLPADTQALLNKALAPLPAAPEEPAAPAP